MSNTLYSALGIDPEASSDEIETAFRQREQALQGQPDALSLLRVAYDTLRQPQQRAAYDRKLQESAEAGRVLPTITHHEPRAAGSRSRARNWAVLLLAASGTIGAFWLTKPAPRAAKPAPAAQTEQSAPPTAATPAPALAPDPMPSQAAAAPAAVPSEPAAAQFAATPSTAPQTSLPTRGAKKAGFDAQYLAWSVFTIRQRNLTGSGVMIGPDRILTNCHVLAGGATNGLVVAPNDIGIKGGGFKHNIDTLLLPTTNMTQLQILTGCTLV